MALAVTILPWFVYLTVPTAPSLSVILCRKALLLSSAGVQRDGARCESVSMRERINQILDTVTHFCFAYLPYIVILGAAFYFFNR